MNVCEAFLYDSEEHQFQVLWQSVQILGQVQADIDVAFFIKSLDVPAQAGLQPHFVQQRRMKQIRRRTQLLRHSSSDLFAFGKRVRQLRAKPFSLLAAL